VRLSALVEERTRELKETHFATLNLLEDLRKENYIRKKSEEALRQSEERFRAVAQSANDAIITTDSNGIILGWNRGAQIIFGYTEEEITGKNLEIIMPQPYAKTYNINHQVNVKDRTPHIIDKTVELYGLRKDRNEFPLELSLAEWETASGKYYTGIIRDITERKQSELLIQKRSEELRIAKDHAEQSDRLKSAFLANMSHEIRTPMNGILGFSALLKEPNLTGEEKQQYISVIEKAGTRMLNIINDIIDISKIEAGLMELNIGESDINEQIEYIYTFFKPEVEAKGMKISYKNALPAKEATIKTDREKLFAILTNLVKNAIKYSEDGHIEFGYYKIAATEHAPLLQFYVKDTGIGVPKDRQEAIFDRFVQADIGDTRAFQGAGLGLSISKAYVEMLGGKIWVESDPEGASGRKGSTFYFTIPFNAEIKPKLLTKQMNSQIKEVSQVDSDVPKLKILIAEDDVISEKLIALAIKMFCKEIFKVRTGVEAVEVCRNNPDMDLILMDIKMPILDGLKAAKQIREFNKNVVIIAQTANALAGDRENSINAGCNDYITKPFGRNALIAIIEKHLRL